MGGAARRWPAARPSSRRSPLSQVHRTCSRANARRSSPADIREVYSEAKGTGFDTKIMRQVIRMRKLDKADFQEQEAMLDLYLTAMDMR